ALLVAAAAAAGLGLLGAPARRRLIAHVARAPPVEERGRALFERRPAEQVVGHRVPGPVAVATLERLDDAQVLVHRERMTAGSLADPQRVHRERTAERLRQSADRRVVRSAR